MARFVLELKSVMVVEQKLLLFGCLPRASYYEEPNPFLKEEKVGKKNKSGLFLLDYFAPNLRNKLQNETILLMDEMSGMV
ncbi:hypothetical protein KFK09_000485 [Dendrobium nobile]|uniref:Uncharacterized protein n=1 Tax=Dendrobium nobile TaxID=94219 RepID=A0A8T3CD95_DENNO|nr:hypothetical protein KFK09_000485 [Dendrobium nobile]